MAKKQPGYLTTAHLTKSEAMLMEIFWEAGRPLNRPEILELVKQEYGIDMPTSTFHLLVNELMALDYITTVSELGGHIKRHTRRFVPKVTRNEHFALQITRSPKFAASDIPAIVCSLFHFASVRDTAGMLRLIEADLLGPQAAEH